MLGCAGDHSGIPDLGLGLSRCTTTPPGTVRFTIGGFYHPDRLVDPTALPLVAKVHVGEAVHLWITADHYCGSGDRPTTWVSTRPDVAEVDGSQDFGELRGKSPGETTVYATTYGSRADLKYYCCGSCSSPAPPPRCRDIPIAAVRVVP
jgi:hypothetical protein